MNNEIDVHVTNDISRDDLTTTKLRQHKSLGTRVARFFTRSSPKKKESLVQGDWLCTVCSFKNVNSDDQCFRCQFFRDKPEPTSKPSTLIQRKQRPGAYKVVETGEHQQLRPVRPVQAGSAYLRKADSQTRPDSVEHSETRLGVSGSSHHLRPRTASSDLTTSHRRTAAPANTLSNSSMESFATTQSPRGKSKVDDASESSHQLRPPVVSSNMTVSHRPTAAAGNTISNSSMESFETQSPRGKAKVDDDALQISDRSIPLVDLYASSNGASVPDLNNGSSTPAGKSSLTYHMQTSYGGWSDKDHGAWECGICTYLNEDALHLTCEVCGSRRDAVSDNAVSDQSSRDVSPERVQHDPERVEDDLRRMRMNELIMMQYELMNDLKNKGSYSDYGESDYESESEGEDQHTNQRSVARQKSFDEIGRHMSEIVSIHEDGRKQQQLMADLQEQQTQSIIDEESAVALPESIEEEQQAGRPLDGRQRMLEWQLELDSNAKKIQELQRHQEELMRAIEKDRSRR